MFCSCFCFSLCKLLRRSLNSSGLGSEVYKYYRMSFQEVIDQPKKKNKHMARVCNRYRERVRSSKTVLLFIVSVRSLFGGTVPTT